MDDIALYWEKQKIEAPKWINTRFLKWGMVWTDAPASLTKESLQYLKDKPNGIILVPGCGYGRNCILFAKNGYRVVGLDNSPLAIDLAKKWAMRESPEIIFLQETVLEIPFLDNTFDAIFFYKTLHQFSNSERPKVIKELARVLLGGGILFLATFSVKDQAFGKGKCIEDNTYDDRGFRPVNFYEIDELKNSLLPYFEIKLIEERIEVEIHREKSQEWKDKHSLIFCVARKL